MVVMKNMILRSIGIYFNTLAVIAPGAAARRAFLLFCRPFRTKITDKQKHFFATSEKFSFEVEDVVIQGYKWGAGDKKIVFLHGWQSHSYRWKLYVEALPKEEFTVYAIDAPGHGLSSGKFLTVPLYSSVIREFLLSLGNVHTVVSHSLGGFSLLYTLFRFPLLPIKKIVLMAPPGEANDFVNVYRQTLGLSEKVISLIGDQFMELYDVKPDFFSTRTFAKAVNISGMIVHDEEDHEAPYHYSVALNSIWKKSRLITTKGYGHNLRSTEVVELVTEFITSDVPHPAVAER